MKSIWWSPRAIGLHVALVVAVPLMLLLGIWQFKRALHGNPLSWAYTVEWPFFAAYATWMWWKLVHDDTPAVPKRVPSAGMVASQPEKPSGQNPSGQDPSAQDRGSLTRVRVEGGPVVPKAGFDPYDEESVDPELAAYNRYLAGLQTSGKRKAR